ncbi:MAG: hypothetical protein KGH64_03400 [Candidatus Micrarchaeota archaeon]|nr:hypothetical protein [Candidatus Micrarchaeota archaeon]MDE1834358.1 hypothetical protein [Candidatus Micrarchaeota archaeon]MDE1859704.1 hypothetical protein [Candidatus Micrarchaeota archaeon]
MPEDKIGLKRVTWQTQNCLACKWFRPSDVLNADLMTNGKCIFPELLPYNLVMTGRDWCNKFEVMPEEMIKILQDEAFKKEAQERKAQGLD